MSNECIKYFMRACVGACASATDVSLAGGLCALVGHVATAENVATGSRVTVGAIVRGDDEVGVGSIVRSYGSIMSYVS